MSYEDQLAELEAFGAALPPPQLERGQQGSPEWLMERVGKVTASRFGDVMDFNKSGKESAKRYGYRMELVVERLTGQPSEHYVSKPMEWGIKQEKAARMAYEARTGSLVIVPRFINHPTIPMCGGSPDGFVDDDGMMEFKAPTSVTHLETLLGGDFEHEAQTQGNLACSPKRVWCDFVSYDPRLPEPYRLYIERRPRDDTYIAKLEAGIIAFQAELQQILDKLKGIA